MSKALGLLMALTLAVQALPAFAQSIDLSGHQEPSGAITVYHHGDTVDPYFATKALLMMGKGEQARRQAFAWIDWVRKYQSPEGLFSRYTRPAGGKWENSAPADADDAMLALWLQLLYRTAPDTGLPEAWLSSASNASRQLEALYMADKGIYQISASLPVGLLMDNIEIYDAFSSMARDMRRMGQFSLATRYQNKADMLRASITAVFYDSVHGEYLVSTQKRDAVPAFYPEAVAQLFPVMYRLLESQELAKAYQEWMKANDQLWFSQKTEDFPWGLIAITAIEMDDVARASCWAQRSEPLRYSARWNVVEDVALQIVKISLKRSPEASKIPCVGSDLL